MQITQETQLQIALGAFALAYGLHPDWASRYFRLLTASGITSMGELAQGCKDNTVNLDLELFGIPPERHLSPDTLMALEAFMPGPIGLRCFRLARKAAEKVKKGTASVKYVHRPESGLVGKERWHIPVGDSWTIHVDCAGFVRNVLKYVTQDAFVMCLSDRDFMRAKDFFLFFKHLRYTVLDKRDLPYSEEKYFRWRRVDDLRMVIPGDIICYRPRGKAAGLASFTSNDREDLNHVLRAVKTAELWHQEYRRAGCKEYGGIDNLVKRNMAKESEVKAWVQATRKKLRQINILTVTQLRSRISSLNGLLEAKGHDPFPSSMLELMHECCYNRALNTGHIVFAAGPAELKEKNEYRIRVVHSTKFGVPDSEGNPTEGVQEYFRRFRLVRNPDGTTSWTRKMALAPLNEDQDVIGPEDDENAMVDMENALTDVEDDGSDDEGPEEEEFDNTFSPLVVDVLAARMCF